MINTKHDTYLYEATSYKHEIPRIYDMNVLYKAFLASKKGSVWKKQTQQFELNLLYELRLLSNELKTRTYQPKPTNDFILNERGKTRYVSGEHIRDRVVQHVVCDEILTPIFNKYLINYNSASRKGKGVQYARQGIERHLRRYYNQHHTNEGYVLLIDFTKYYDNIRHDKLRDIFNKYVHDDDALWLLKVILDDARIDVSYMSDDEYEHCMDNIFNSLEYHKIDKSLFTKEKYMAKHLNIGNQVAQIAGIVYPMRFDNYIKIVRGIKLYGRYMDDSYVIHRDKDYLKQLLSELTIIANELGITINPHKTRICKLSSSWRFLQIKYTLTETGRIIKRINPKRVVKMRQKMRKMVNILSLNEFENWYKSWFRGYYKYMSKIQRCNLDALFQQCKEAYYMYTLILTDGTTIENLALNGTNYISKERIDESIFEDNLDTLTIRDQYDQETTLNNVVFVEQQEREDGFYISFRERTEDELYKMEIDAKLEYLAMMMDIEL